MTNQTKSNETLLVCFFIGVIILIFYVLGGEKDTQDVASLITCDYPEEFLSSKDVGLINQKSCQSMFVALHKQHLDECYDKLHTPNLKAEEVSRLVDRCVYISIEKDQLPLIRDYEIYLSNKK